MGWTCNSFSPSAEEREIYRDGNMLMSSECCTQWKECALNEIRSSGYWVMKERSAVKWVILRCVTYR